MTLLCRCPDVPTEASVNAAEQLLVQIQALNAETGLLTALGRHLSTLPCMPRVGKLCIYGALMGCTYSASAVAACMTVRSPFISSQDSDMQRRVQNAKVCFAFHTAVPTYGAPYTSARFQW
jgi:ATP-dependent RNA helicase DHX57